MLKHLKLVPLLLALLPCLPPPAAAAPSPTGRSPKLVWTPQRQDAYNRLVATNDSLWQLIRATAARTGTSSPRYDDRGQ